MSFALLWWFREAILPLMVADKISVSNLFTAIFGWASIQTGCVFAIYGFVGGKTDGFIGEVRHTRSMKRYNTYIKRAIWSGFLLTLSSMPLIVWKFTPAEITVPLFLLFAFWFSVFVWAFFSFARVAFIFGVLTQVGEPSKVGAG